MSRDGRHPGGQLHHGFFAGGKILGGYARGKPALSRGRIAPAHRPYLAHHVALLITHSPDTSFPSDHTTLAFAIAIAVWKFHRRAGIALFVFGLLVAFARVFVGAHYPGDVIGGAVLGGVTSVLVLALAELAFVRTALDRLFLLLTRARLASAAN